MPEKLTTIGKVIAIHNRVIAIHNRDPFSYPTFTLRGEGVVIHCLLPSQYDALVLASRHMERLLRVTYLKDCNELGIVIVRSIEPYG